MNLEPAPRLSKTVFLVIDAVLLITAFLIVYFSKNPYAPLPFVATVLFVGAAGVVGLIPFLIDYAADSAEYVQQERERVTDQVQRLQTAAESLARAAAQIKAVEEAVHKTAHAAENLPYRMQEKLAEFNEALAEKEGDDREALEQELAELRAANSDQLKAAAEKIHKAAADWAALEAATRKQLTAAEAALAKIQGAAGDTAAKFETRLAAALATLDTRLATFETSGSAGRRSAPPMETAPAPAEEKRTAPESVVESVAVVETGSNPAEPASSTTTEEPKARKPRAPRKPKPEEIASAAGDGPISGESAFPDSPGESTSTSASVDESATSAAPAETSASSDGATRLLATAYIGIGNKLFIRGDGPGLSWDHGVPMQFVSIGKWGWATNDAAAAVRCKLYKNDETAAVSGEVVLEPGKHVEVTALF
jgi:chemotaxis protein histidine kinase CheA